MAWWDELTGEEQARMPDDWVPGEMPLSGTPSDILAKYNPAIAATQERAASSEFQDFAAQYEGQLIDGKFNGFTPWELFHMDRGPGGSPFVGSSEDGDDDDVTEESGDPTDTDEFRSLKEVFLGGLEQIGLDDATAQSLWEWAEKRFVADSSFTAAQANVEMKDQKAFKDRFPGIASMRDEKNADGSPAARRDIPTPGEYLARERAWATHLGKYGMSALGADLNTMVAQSYMKSIGEGEFVDRLKAASEMIYEAPEAVKTTFGDWFGNHADAALMAVFLDPSNEVFNDDWIGLKGDVAAAEVGGWSRMHLGLDAPVTQERSRAIAGLGWRDIDVWEGLDRLKAKEDLFIERIGEVDYKMEVEGVAAEFGIDTEALSGVELNELIDRRATRRSADFSGGGGAMLSGTTTGFGAANA